MSVGAFVPLLVWSVYLRTQIPADTYQSTKLLGFLDAAPSTADAAGAARSPLALMVVGAWRWRREPLLGLTALGFLGCCAFYIGDQFLAHGLPRVSAAGVAIGLAALDLLAGRACWIRRRAGVRRARVS